ncbi:MAG: hypothetical protein QF438_01125 [Phycisphaerales bacterium]|jgi:predicted nucleic acid-binding protein|nr:hypothetical protein [Phycisphaerales bacterium]MDP7086521.1 hypothetical protein [Phycisphaerales bacterium]MDP7188335.1 hypothetical protein [Phycisphaerales bacterium]MDP7518732.1 hypothetical protein [Phycisphaerales bacterium]HCA38206.1 hypothetical protein [Phycisphaerales bacterium]|tara:strand:+ start:447 stop:1235 length:789 start_codon:yes stop_codon:yes gene_type:complete
MSRRRNRGAPISFFSFQDVMVGTIGIVLIITLVLLLNIGQHTLHAVTHADQIDTETERSVLDERLALLTERIGVDELRNAYAETRLQLNATQADNTIREERWKQLRDERDAHFLALQRSDDVQMANLLTVEQDRLRDEIETQRRRRQVSYLIDEEESDTIVAELMSDRLVISSVRASDTPMAVDSDDPALLARILLEKWLVDSAERTTHILLSLKPSGRTLWSEINRLRDSDPRFKNLSIGLDLIGEDATTTRLYDAVEPNP